MQSRRRSLLESVANTAKQAAEDQDLSERVTKTIRNRIKKLFGEGSNRRTDRLSHHRLAVETQPRKCLNCREMFNSEGIQNRICYPCRNKTRNF